MITVGNQTSSTQSSPSTKDAWTPRADNTYKYERYIPQTDTDQLHAERNNQLDALRRMAMGMR